ncbi:hypothetical protein EVAR_90666_1 [Eumeta japonica]|uniref:Uncharacterized protein n=1 Tax=Eumeta variegata TaxID=151549 RepID=A0A4C1ZE03_EUMVA|nr:hypothetical protein EVAR_90666_1 [Eumeta japonica]
MYCVIIPDGPTVTAEIYSKRLTGMCEHPDINFCLQTESNVEHLRSSTTISIGYPRNPFLGIIRARVDPASKSGRCGPIKTGSHSVSVVDLDPLFLKIPKTSPGIFHCTQKSFKKVERQIRLQFGRNCTRRLRLTETEDGKLFVLCFRL